MNTKYVLESYLLAWLRDVKFKLETRLQRNSRLNKDIL